MTDQGPMKSEEVRSMVAEIDHDSDGEDYATILLHRLWKSDDEVDLEVPDAQEHECEEAGTYSNEKESEEPAGISAPPESVADDGEGSNILRQDKEEPAHEDAVDTGSNKSRKADAPSSKVLSTIGDSSICTSRVASSSYEENTSIITDEVQVEALPQQETAAIETSDAENDVNSPDTRVNTGFMMAWNSISSDVRTMWRIVWNRLRHLRSFLIKIIEIMQNWARRGISGARIAGTIIQSAIHSARNFVYGVDWTSSATLQKLAAALCCIWTFIIVVRRLIVQRMRAALTRFVGRG